MCARRYNVAIRAFHAAIATCWIPILAGAVLASGAVARAHDAGGPNAAAPGAQSAADVVDVRGDSFHDAARSRMIPASDAFAASVQLVVYKSSRILAVYRAGTFVKEYRVVLGRQPEGRKRHEHDARTPEGRYRVTATRPHDRWQHFLALDYPNAADRRRYETELRAGTIPDEDGAPFAIGNAIGIHGSDRQEDQAAGRDWTKGCIALSPDDIDELAALVTVGTTVWIVR